MPVLAAPPEKRIDEGNLDVRRRRPAPSSIPAKASPSVTTRASAHDLLLAPLVRWCEPWSDIVAEAGIRRRRSVRSVDSADATGLDSAVQARGEPRGSLHATGGGLDARPDDEPTADDLVADPARGPDATATPRSCRAPIEGPIHRYTYRDAHVRARRLARALGAPGRRMRAIASARSRGTAIATSSSTTRCPAWAR